MKRYEPLHESNATLFNLKNIINNFISTYKNIRREDVPKKKKILKREVVDIEDFLSDFFTGDGHSIRDKVENER